MKGTALFVKQVSNVVIDTCTFIQNGPVVSIMEILFSPYLKYLSQGLPLTFRDPICSDEFSFLDKCYNSSGENLFWPRV